MICRPLLCQINMTISGARSALCHCVSLRSHARWFLSWGPFI